MQDQKNTIIAIVLSAIVLIAWQYFFATPQANKQRQLAEQQRLEQSQQPPAASAGGPTAQPSNIPLAPGQVGTAGAPLPREKVIAETPRITIDTSSVKGSIALKGARLDDLSLVKYRETVDPNSPAIVLLAPSGTAEPFYAEFGWVAGPGATFKVPNADTEWRQEGSGALQIGRPITLVWDNGEGLEFRRTISVDDKYLFTLKDSVRNTGANPVTIYPYALISRHGTPKTLGYYILHEGLIGVMGDQGLQELSYKTVEDKKLISFNVTNAWLGITDKYWAATLLPNTDARLDAHFSAGQLGSIKTYQTDYLLDGRTIQPGGTASADARLFAGAKEVSVVNEYNDTLRLNLFDRLIDWGWFYFITKPMFWALDSIYKLVGNFGIAILIVTVIIKLIFFPLANKSYASMAKMKTLQPKMQALRERYPDDKVKQQQELMELYKSEKINPIAGCLPILIQVPVFFSLYKVLFVTIEMRHAPFYGWIKDLSAPDPTTVFNLFGLIPWDPSHVPILGAYMMVGAWPLIMGVTMWAQMKLNPPPPDPAQKMIFDWMPVIFTFMLASFSAGLVIYWAWNNTLSVLQQSVIMQRHGAKIELFDNFKSIAKKLKDLFNKRPPVV
ncbi:MAG TPA: membrane protein insertase YidC [Xanthobacteraceae bacterium]|nr:membrane protein insertase YidC [Xanthobacteraceae bacterium]